MAIQFACPWCTQTISVDDSKARERVECPYCNRPVKVPTESTHDLPPPLPLPSQNMEDPPPSRTVPKRRWLGVLLSLFVPGFGLVRAGCVRRGVVWFFALHLLGVLLPLLFICSALPTWICLVATLFALGCWLAMLVDSFRSGKLTIPLFVAFVLVLVATAILPSPGHLVAHPFKIPKGAMQPTLNGIIGHPSSDPPPNVLRQIAEFVVLGRNYINVVSREDEQIVEIVPRKVAFFFTFSRLVCERQNFIVYAPPDTLRQDFNVFPGRLCHRGEIIARGAIGTGDYLFVDKLTYKFFQPHRGDLVVFHTSGISGINADTLYVKRLAGLPGDTLRINPPFLYVNGQLASGTGFRRVMSATDGYRGYALGHAYLARPDKEFQVPKESYFVLGDNSYNSFDSRYWGCVPTANIYGRVARIYYPFSRVGVPQ